jgi:hypothetical protein
VVHSGGKFLNNEISKKIEGGVIRLKNKKYASKKNCYILLIGSKVLFIQEYIYDLYRLCNN